MKKDLTMKQPRNVIRTIEDFNETLLTLLETHSFEDITIKDICTNSNYPRTTFYNYFYDKYDLLEYTLSSAAQNITIDLSHSHTSNELVIASFEQLYSYLIQHQNRLVKILKYNPSGSLMIEFDRYITAQILTGLKKCRNKKDLTLPLDLLARHYSHTILLVLGASFKTSLIPIEQSKSYLIQLLNTHMIE